MLIDKFMAKDYNGTFDDWKILTENMILRTQSLRQNNDFI